MTTHTIKALIKRAEWIAHRRADTSLTEGKLGAFTYWLEKANELRHGIVSGYIGRN